MIGSYAASVAGPWHLSKGIPCQDAYCSASGHDFLVGAVADGLGSEDASDIGAAIAARLAVKSLASSMAEHGMDGATPDLLRASFSSAWQGVNEIAATCGLSVGEMDCTLCVAAFGNGRVLWGSVGDSGLVVCHRDGSYKLVTSCQRDYEGRVYPLCFEDHWEFGGEEGVSSLVLATDGVLWDMFAPPSLGPGMSLDPSALRPFLHAQPNDEAILDELALELEDFLSALPQQVANDDRTVLVAFDPDRPPRDMPDAYYEPKDWASVEAEVLDRLYPKKLDEAGGAACQSADEAKPADRGSTPDASFVPGRDGRMPTRAAAMAGELSGAIVAEAVQAGMIVAGIVRDVLDGGADGGKGKLQNGCGAGCREEC